MNLHDYQEALREATNTPLAEHGVPGLPADPNEARDFLRRLDREMAQRMGTSVHEVLKESGHRFAHGLTDGSYHD